MTAFILLLSLVQCSSPLEEYSNTEDEESVTPVESESFLTETISYTSNTRALHEAYFTQQYLSRDLIDTVVDDPRGIVVYKLNTLTSPHTLRLVWGNDIAVHLLGPRIKSMVGETPLTIFPALDNEAGHSLLRKYRIAAYDQKAFDLGVIGYGDDNSPGKVYKTEIRPIGKPEDFLLAVIFTPLADLPYKEGVVYDSVKKLELEIESLERLQKTMEQRIEVLDASVKE